MNENDGGTPNPLNQNPLDANPSEPMKEVSEVEVRETGEIDDLGHRRQVSDQNQPLTEELVEESVMVESLDPEGKPMEKAEPKAEDPKPKKKTGLIIGIIVCLFVAVGCGVAATLMMMNESKDPVAAAMEKLMNGKAPKNVAIDGEIEFLFDEEVSPLSKILIDLDSKAQTGSMINSTSAKVELILANEEEMSLEFNQVYGADGDLYFKLDGVSDLIEKINLLAMLSEDTDMISEDIELDYSMEIANSMLGMLPGVISIIDGEWVKISIDEATSLSDGMMVDSDTSCMMNLIDSINTNSNSAAELYNKNPFLASTTEGVNVNNKFNPIRQVTIDDEKFANFVNSIQNAKMTDDLYDCLGLEGNLKITANDVAKIVGVLPAFYVEVDNDDNFSRLYFNAVSEDGSMTTKVDLAFTYPATINVSEPKEYTDFEEIFQMIFMNMFDLDSMMQTEVIELHS